MNSEMQIRELEKAMKLTKDRRLFERYQAVKLVLEGRKQNEVAKIIGRTPHTIGHYMKDYRKDGLAGLEPKKQSGRPNRLSKEQQAEIRDIIANKTPADVGFNARYNWTLSLAAQLIERKWGFTYSIKGVDGLLHRLGLSCTRPTYTLKKADPEKQKKFVDVIFPELKKN